MVPMGAWGDGYMRADLSTPGLVRLASGLLCAAAALRAAGLSAAGAQFEAPAAEARAEHELSREQAVALVQKRYGARVVRADIADQDGRHVYVFRLLSAGGKVWVVRVDACTGTEVP
jgi:uncharacterized membrane protein YkoI